MNNILVCRRSEDEPKMLGAAAECERCKKAIIVEGGSGQPESHVCIHCVYKTDPDLVLMVELPPDEFGSRSTVATLRDVYEKNSGQWHKTGLWHNPKWVLDRLE